MPNDQKDLIPPEDAARLREWATTLAKIICRDVGVEFSGTFIASDIEHELIAVHQAATAAERARLPRHPMKGWPLPWHYDTLQEKVIAADGHEVCDFGASDRSEADELAHWVVAVVNRQADVGPEGG